VHVAANAMTNEAANDAQPFAFNASLYGVRDIAEPTAHLAGVDCSMKRRFGYSHELLSFV
jgi:hypothetical protein